MQLVSLHLSYEFEYFYQCIMTFWGLRDSRGPIWMHLINFLQNNDIDPENLFGEFGPLCSAAGRTGAAEFSSIFPAESPSLISIFSVRFVSLSLS